MNLSKPVPSTGDAGDGKTKPDQSRFMKLLSAHKLTAFDTKKEKAKKEKLKLKQAALQAASEQQQALAVGVQINGSTAHVSSSKLHELLNNTQPSSGSTATTTGNTRKTPASTGAAAPHPDTRSRSSSSTAESTRDSLSTSVVESAVSMNRTRNMSSHIFDAEELPIQPPAAAPVPALPPLSPKRFPPTQHPPVHPPPTPQQQQMTYPLSPRQYPVSYNGPPSLHMQIPPAAYAQMLHTQQQQLSARMRAAEQQQIPAGYHYHHPALYQQQLAGYHPYYAQQQQQQQQSQPSLNTLHGQTPSGTLLPLLQPQLVSPRFDANNRPLYTGSTGTFFPTAATHAQHQQPTTTTTSSLYANNPAASNTLLSTATGTAPTVGEFSEIRLHNQRSSVFAAAASTAAAPSHSTVDADELLRKQRIRQETQRVLLQQIQEKKAKVAQEKQRVAREEQLEEERIQREIHQLKSGTTGTTVGNMQQQRVQQQLSQTSSSSVASIAAEDVTLLHKLQADAEKVKSHKLHQHHRNGLAIQEEEKQEQEGKARNRRRRGAEGRREDYEEQKDQEYWDEHDVVDDGYDDEEDPAYNSYHQHDGYTHSQKTQPHKHKTHSYNAEQDRAQLQSSWSRSSSASEETEEQHPRQQRHAMSNKGHTNNNPRHAASQQQHNIMDEYGQEPTMPVHSISKRPTQLQRIAGLTLQQQHQRGVGARHRLAAGPLPNTKAYQQQQAAIRLMSGKSSIHRLKHKNTEQASSLQATQQATTDTRTNSKRSLHKGGPLLPSLPTGVLVGRRYAGSQYDGQPTLSARTLVDQLEGTSEFLLPQDLDLPSFRK